MLLRYAVVLLSAALVAAERPAPPSTRTDDVVDTIHGVRVPDPYRWLEDQTSPETRAWIDAQTRYMHSVLRDSPARARIADRLRELMRVETLSVPIVRRNRYFFTKRTPDRSQADLYLRRGSNGRDEMLVDANALSPDHSMSVRIIEVSPDGRYLAYGIQAGGQDEVDLRIWNADSGRQLPDTFPKARYWTMVFRNDGAGVYYTRMDAHGPRVLYHRFGSDSAGDKIVFGASAEPKEIIGIASSPGSRHLLIHEMEGAAANQVRVYVKQIDSDAAPVPVVTDVPAVFDAQISGTRIYLQTNWNAPNGRVMVADVAAPARANWRELVPESSATIDSIAPSGDRVLVNYLDAAVSCVEIFGAAGKRLHTVRLPVKGTADRFVSSDDGSVYFGFVSFAVPLRILRCDLSSGVVSQWYAVQAPLDSDAIEVRQVWYGSKDGTRVPMFVAHRKGLPLDGNRPVLLTGYGGFRSPMTPGFRPYAIVFMEQGGVFALPNLRGGSEFGEKWHQAGMLDRKQNVFDDFIGAAEWLISNRYTRPSRLSIMGGSNGGLLVGAAMVQRPDLFQAVICAVPLLDMIRYHQFLVARWWVPEYGSSDDPQQFKYLLRYSPYHNVKRGVNYPAVMFMTGDSDTRVAPLHARKMTAMMQAATASERPIVLHYDTKAGHSGGKPIDEQIADTADELSFVFGQLGMSYSGQ